MPSGNVRDVQQVIVVGMAYQESLDFQLRHLRMQPVDQSGIGVDVPETHSQQSRIGVEWCREQTVLAAPDQITAGTQVLHLDNLLPGDVGWCQSINAGIGHNPGADSGAVEAENEEQSRTEYAEGSRSYAMPSAISHKNKSCDLSLQAWLQARAHFDRFLKITTVQNGFPI